MHPFIAAEYARVAAEDRRRQAAHARLIHDAAPITTPSPRRARRLRSWRWRVTQIDC
jgi:hypothetical protein